MNTPTITLTDDQGHAIEALLSLGYWSGPFRLEDVFPGGSEEAYRGRRAIRELVAAGLIRETRYGLQVRYSTALPAFQDWGTTVGDDPEEWR